MDHINQIMGRVFNIQRFSVHDGPGIRTTVFLKGCSLRCRWCHNPESYKRELQVRYQADKCAECGTCAQVCPNGVYVQDKRRIRPDACTACGRCVEECLYGALEMWGEDLSAGQVMEIVRRDADYFLNSGGGLTISGGEPLLQPDFVRAVFEKAREEGIHTALDTAGNVPYSHMKQVLPFTDLVLLDLKIMDEAQHKRYTGVSNGQIFDNAKRLFESGTAVQIRVPLIKDVNDSLENARMLKDFIQGYPNIERVKLLPYHSMGVGKAESIGEHMETFASPTEDRLAEIRKILEPFAAEE